MNPAPPCALAENGREKWAPSSNPPIPPPPKPKLPMKSLATITLREWLTIAAALIGGIFGAGATFATMRGAALADHEAIGKLVDVPAHVSNFEKRMADFDQWRIVHANEAAERNKLIADVNLRLTKIETQVADGFDRTKTDSDRVFSLLQEIRREQNRLMDQAARK